MWITSFLAVLKKNYIYKVTTCKDHHLFLVAPLHSPLEIFFPLYFLVIIIIITKTGQKLNTKIPEEIFSEVPTNFVCDGYRFLSAALVFIVGRCTVGWAPANSSLALSVIDDIQSHNNLTNITLRSFDSEADFEAAYTANHGTLYAGIIFTGGEDFSIRMNESYMSNLNATRYVTGGYLGLQRMLHESLINVIVGGTERVQLNYSTKAFPIAAYAQPSVTYYLWAFYFPIIYGYSLVHVITGVVTEKEKKLKDAMRTMGCPPSAYWFSWFCIQLLMIFLATVIFLVVAYVAGVFSFHILPFMALFVTFLLYALCLTTMGFLVSVFADTPRTGVIGAWLFLLLQSALGGVGHFLIYKRAPWVKTLFSFLPVVPLMESVLLWADAEAQGVRFSLSSHAATGHIIALVYDCVIYGVFAAYFEKALNE